ncbi:MAG: hypothetical protein GY777_12110 [Candidatus Brocadiaceae bacterium]|nr:hypothetical protein [Candidatus Brocadiaceae bacterium]
MAKFTVVTPPDWDNPLNAKARIWCIENGITISTFATTPGFGNRTWEIQLNVNGRKITSPKEYGPNELYSKVFELYKFYYNKYNG